MWRRPAVRSGACVLVGVVALLASGGCDLSFFPDAIVTSQNAYDFGLSEFPWELAQSEEIGRAHV